MEVNGESWWARTQHRISSWKARRVDLTTHHEHKDREEQYNDRPPVGCWGIALRSMFTCLGPAVQVPPTATRATRIPPAQESSGAAGSLSGFSGSRLSQPKMSHEGAHEEAKNPLDSSFRKADPGPVVDVVPSPSKDAATTAKPQQPQITPPPVMPANEKPTPNPMFHATFSRQDFKPQPEHVGENGNTDWVVVTPT